MAVAIPALESSVVGDPRFAATARTGPNGWALSTLVDPDLRAAALEAAARPGPPSAIVDASGATGSDGAVLRVELDACGAWVTLANAGGPRPIVLRRAGWLDIRGHPTPQDDRVGLGPGDAVVLVGRGVAERTDATGEAYGSDALPSTLLHLAGAEAEDIAFRCWSGAQRLERPGRGVEAVAVLRVPDDLGPDPVQRVADATGVAVDHLVLPGYPLGDLAPDLWKRPPKPPREARLLLPPEAARVPEVRRLLDRLIASWRLEQRIAASDVALLATEVATNAVLHAGTDAVVVLRYLGDRLRVEVVDASPVLPRRRIPSPEVPTGRGIGLVATLSSAWGVERTRGGKRVWFEVPVAEPVP